MPLLASAGCDRGAGGPVGAPALSSALGSDGGAPDLLPSLPLEVSPTQLQARQHVGGANEPQLSFTFRVPSTLSGGGVPADPTKVSGDQAIAQLELPQGASVDEDSKLSAGVADFSSPLFCKVGDAGCTSRGADGYWKAEVLPANGGATREVQVGFAISDYLNARKAYENAIGVFLAANDQVVAGDRLRLTFVGVISGRATAWTQRPFLAHFRYRTFNGGVAGGWTTLGDNDVRALDIQPRDPAFIRVQLPLDTQVNVPFTLAVVVTDRYGNPSPPVAGMVQIRGDVTADLMMNDWRAEVQGVVLAAAGAHRVAPSLGGTRGVAQWTYTWAGAPPFRHLLGDTHSHSGDGGAQRKFIGTFLPGDHDALYSRSFDQLRYMHQVAGLDFGAVSEHAVRDESYQAPPGVAADPMFQPGGTCYGTGDTVRDIVGWWPRQQQIVQQYDAQAAGRFVVFPAFEWHATHSLPGDKSLLHRVVMFRDFAADPNVGLPILPGDVSNLPPQCIVRFLDKAGFDPSKALVIPHMMTSTDRNIDWDLTYANSPVAPRSTMELYHRVGEIFSARAIDQFQTPTAGRSLLYTFEGDNNMRLAAGNWTFRHGWKDVGAHIGAIGSSDNHSQFAGVNDDLTADPSPTRYTSNEPGGYAVALATTADRGGIYGALSARRSYATSGVRAWLYYDVAGQPMGSQIASAAASVTARISLMVGMPIQRVELWSAKVGDTNGNWSLANADLPGTETYSTQLQLANPVAVGGGPQEWLYYVRAWLKTSGSSSDSDEAVWSSPVWVTWSR